ncbi:hypothetical protein [Acidithiobacillus sp.]|nr:hypothetical protein [Acidithiobacillus sp.]MDD2749652.1 hypothetical protein [Acidithiobacillus sp.]MDD5279182.1 hypothetical protein [Acidithiobacillus sp.]
MIVIAIIGILAAVAIPQFKCGHRNRRLQGQQHYGGSRPRFIAGGF